METTASRTAQHVALFRALESVRRGPRLFVDPYAVAALGPGYRLVVAFARLPLIGVGVESYIDERWPGGPRASAVVRTRLIDDLLTAAVADGAGQVLLLGAGYDSRAYRLPVLRTVDVVEIDHPATQARKRALVARRTARRILGWAGRRAPAAGCARVRFVALDLISADLGKVLPREGIRHERSVVVWEGVTNYLDPPSVHSTLTGLAGALAAGSRIIFTYLDQRALDGSGGFTGFAEWAGTVRAAGEPFTFGFVPDQLPGYLAARGMTLISDCSALEAAQRYLEPLGRHEPAAPFYRIAQAEVS